MHKIRLKKGILWIIAFLVLVGIIFMYNNLFNNEIIPKNVQCEQIENSLARDICYKDIAIKDAVIEESEKENCYLIDSIYLQYMCFRLGFRPHMNEFMTGRGSNVSYDNFMEECSIYDEDIGLYCIYLKAAELAKNDFDGAKQICNKFEDEKLKSECSFYIVSSLVMNIEENTSEKIGFIMDFCSNVPYPSWKSECYYVLADELALIENTPYLKEISEACKESYLANVANDYFCFHHVTYFMSLEKTEEYCKLVEPTRKIECYIDLEKFYDHYFGDNISIRIERCNMVNDEFREYCFRGFGFSIGWNSDVPEGVNKCNSIPDEFREYCFKGLGYSIRWEEGISSGIEKCNEIPVEFREYCFEGLGQFRGFGNNFSLGIKTCNEVPVEFRGYCFSGLGQFKALGNNFSSVIETCNEIPVEFRDDCFEGFGYSVGPKDKVTLGIKRCNNVSDEFKMHCFRGFGFSIGWNSDVPEGVNKCNNIPDEFREYCFDGMSNFIKRYFNYNNSLLIEKCNEFPEEFRDDCLMGLTS